MAPGVTFPLEDGRAFVSTEDPVTQILPPLPEACDERGKSDDAMLARLVNKLWAKAYEGRQPAHARLRQCERYYRGLHFREDEANARLEITNFAHSNTEVVTALLNQHALKPRPKPLNPMAEEKVKRIREFGFWWLNRSRAANVRANATRTKAKYGCACLMLTMDPATGFVYVLNWSLFDFYPDPSGRDLPSCQYFFFAAPFATRMLRAMFPGSADKIVPDGYTSPAYDVNVIPDRALYRDQYQRHAMTQMSVTNAESTSPYRTSPQPSGSAIMAPSYGQEQNQGSETTFVLQLIVRDYGKNHVDYPGKVMIPAGPDDPEGPIALEGQIYRAEVPACKSGWRLITMTSNGVKLCEEPVDECWGGLPFVLDYHVRHDGRIDGIGEIDNVIPINRSYNERKQALNFGSRLACTPVFIAPKGSGIKTGGTIAGGETLEPQAGRASEIRWMEYDGPKAPLFEHLQTEKTDMEIVSGVHMALQGIRPEGVETGVALRALQGASAIRIEAKIPETNQAWAEILQKAVRAMSKKLQVPIMFEATNGQMLGVTANDLDGEYEYEIPNENSIDAEQKKKDDASFLYQAGVLAPDDLLQAYEWPDWARVAERARAWIIEQKMAEAAARAQAEAQRGGSGGKGSGGAGGSAPADSGPPGGVGRAA